MDDIKDADNVKKAEAQYNEAVDNDPAIQAIINSDIEKEIKNEKTKEDVEIDEETSSEEEPAIEEETNDKEANDEEEPADNDGDSHDTVEEEVKPLPKARNDASKRINELVRKNKEAIEEKISHLSRIEAEASEALANREIAIKAQQALLNYQLENIQSQYYSAMELGDSQKAKELDAQRFKLIQDLNTVQLYAEDFEVNKRQKVEALKALQAERNQLIMSKQNPIVAQDKAFTEFLAKHTNLDRNSDNYNPDDEQEVFVIATNIERNLKERGEGHLVRTKWFWNEVDRAINSYQEKMQAPSKTLPLKQNNVDVAPVVKQNSPRGQVVGSNKLPELSNEEREMALSLRNVLGGNMTDKQLIEHFAKSKKLTMQEEKRGR